jgi:hypothetical protein
VADHVPAKAIHRKVVQMQIVQEGSYEHWYVLCDDGTMWKLKHDVVDGGEHTWQQVSGPPPRIVRGSEA